MPAGELEQRRTPVARAAEVGDDRDQGALLCEPRDEPERLAERGRAAALEHAARVRSESSSPIIPARPCRGGRTSARSPPKATNPSRLPRRLARWPSASATPSATSAFRRSAVPKDIEGDTSSASQVTSTRSARSIAHVRLAGPRGHVPLDPAHVVARHVRAHLRELAAGAEQAPSGGRRPASPRRGA